MCCACRSVWTDAIIPSIMRPVTIRLCRCITTNGRSRRGTTPMDAFVMGKWKRMRIFLKYQHVNKGLFGNGEYSRRLAIRSIRACSKSVSHGDSMIDVLFCARCKLPAKQHFMLKKTVLTFAFLTILTTFYGFNAQFSAPATDDALNALARCTTRCSRGQLRHFGLRQSDSQHQRRGGPRLAPDERHRLPRIALQTRHHLAQRGPRPDADHAFGGASVRSSPRPRSPIRGPISGWPTN